MSNTNNTSLQELKLLYIKDLWDMGSDTAHYMILEVIDEEGLDAGYFIAMPEKLQKFYIKPKVCYLKFLDFDEKLDNSIPKPRLFNGEIYPWFKTQMLPTLFRVEIPEEQTFIIKQLPLLPVLYIFGQE